MGACSRREADHLTEVGKVLVDNRSASTGQKVIPGREVVRNGRVAWIDRSHKPRPVLLAMNKPRGIIYTTTGKDRAENTVGFSGYPERIYSVGRLDKDSEGLLLMANQGDLVNKIVRGGNAHEKEYIIIIDKPVTGHFLEQVAEGIRFPELDQVTRPCKAEKMERSTFSIILTQGLNRQIRRMCEACDRQVRRPARVCIMNIRLDNLGTGACRQITKEGYEELTGLLRDSFSLSFGGRKNR